MQSTWDRCSNLHRRQRLLLTGTLSSPDACCKQRPFVAFIRANVLPTAACVAGCGLIQLRVQSGEERTLGGHRMSALQISRALRSLPRSTSLHARCRMKGQLAPRCTVTCARASDDEEDMITRVLVPILLIRSMLQKH